MDKHDDTVEPEDEHQLGQRPGYVDMNGRLAGVIAGKISEQVTANLLSALQMSMLSCESRLIQEINKAMAARPRELDTMSSVSGPTSERRFPPRPSRAGTGRSTPREDFPAELPSWVKKSIKKSGGIPSMKDLENCHADYLMEELKSTHRNREKLVTKRKPPADANDSRGSAHESRRDGISRSQSGRSFASSATHRSPRRSSPSRAQAMGPPGSPPPDGPPLRLPPLPLIGADVPLHLVAGTNRQEDERHTPTSIVERPSFSSDAGARPELELEDVFTRQKTPQSIREESNHEMQAPGSNEAEQADRGPSRSGSPGHARHARPRDSFEDDSELGLGIQEPGEDQPEQPRRPRRSRFESIARRVLLGRSTPSQEAMDDIRPGEAPVSYLARQILNNPGNTRSSSSITGTRNFNRIVPGDLSMHSGHEQRPTFDGDSHTLQAIRSLASERSVVTVRSERSGPSTPADRDSSKLRAACSVLMGDWNNMQAQFRRATGFSELSIVTTFLVVSLVMVSGIILPLQSADKDVRTLWVLAVASPLAVSTGRFFTKAAEVTEKCRRAPALVNSLPMAKEMDERFYIVHFISQSYAGFFIQEVPINGTMVLKLGHVGFLAVFAVISHLLSS